MRKVNALVVVVARHFHCGDIDKSGLRIKRHWLPIMATASAGPYRSLAGLIARIGGFNWFPAVDVYPIRPSDLDEFLCRNKLAGFAIDDIKETVFGCLHQHSACLSRY